MFITTWGQQPIKMPDSHTPLTHLQKVSISIVMNIFKIRKIYHGTMSKRDEKHSDLTLTEKRQGPLRCFQLVQEDI